MEMFSKELDFIGVENRRTRNNTDIQLVILGDQANYEKEDFFKRDDLKLDGIMQGDKVIARFNMYSQGYNRRVDLVGIEKVKK